MTAKRWPRWSADLIKSGFPQTSLLAGTEPAVWQALGRLKPEDFDDGKQVVLRKALDVGNSWTPTRRTFSNHAINRAPVFPALVLTHGP